MRSPSFPRSRIAPGGLLLLLLLLLCSVAPASDSRAAGASCPVANGAWQTFGYQGNGPQYVRAPLGVKSVSVQVRGGHGGYSSTTGRGGSPGLVEGHFGFTGRPCFEIYVADWGGGTGWGYGTGGGRGVQVGAGHDGAGGGGASALVVNDTTLIIAGGGGGGGGDGTEGTLLGGDGGDGAGGEGPGTPNGGEGGNGTAVPDMDLGGLGGIESGRDGGHGVPGTVDLFAGAGGGGGGGAHGGGGGGAWMGTSVKNIELPYGGGGGGGGSSSAVTAIVADVQYLVSSGGCTADGANCPGVVSIQWDEHASKIAPYAGKSQSTPVTAEFASSLEALVTAESGDPIPGIEVTFDLPGNGPGGTFTSPGNPRQATVTTGTNGIAKSPPIRANRIAGHWSATASADSIKDPAHFALANRPAKTATALYSAPEPSSLGEPVKLTAVVGASPTSADPPTGQVVFRADEKIIGDPVTVGGDGVAISDPVNLTVGKHSIDATFAGNASYLVSRRQTTHLVRPGTSVVSLESGSNPSSPGDQVVFDAEVAPSVAGANTPTGSVQFTVDGEDSGPPVDLSSGEATTGITLNLAGSYLVRAVYSGDPDYSPARGTLIQAVGDAATATTVSSSAPATTFGDPLTLTATVDGPVPVSGEVSFAASARELSEFELCPGVTLVGGQAECVISPPLPSGRFEIQAGFVPDQVGTDPSEGRTTQLVTPAPSRTEVEAVPDPLAFGQHFQAEAVVTSPSPGPVDPLGRVQFSVGGVNLGDPVELSAGEAVLPAEATPLLAGGPHPIGAAFGGDRDFRPGAAATVLTVERADTVTGLTSGANPASAGAAVDLTATVKRVDGNGTAVDGSIRFWADGNPRGDPVPVSDGSATATIDGLQPGTHDLRAYFSSPGDYQPSEASLTQTVNSPRHAPEGIYPCGRRRVTLTAVYRRGRTLRFEGATRRSMRGMRVRILSRGKSISRATVRPDGTFWAASRLPRVRRLGATRYRAVVNGRRSHSRRLSRPIKLVRRSPRGTVRTGRAAVVVRARTSRRRALVLIRQRSCRMSEPRRIRRVVTNRRGRVKVGLRRPRAGRPFAVYRLMTPGGRLTSTPILMRAPR